LLKHPSYYIFKLVSNHARGEALDVLVKAPQVETKQYDAVPALDASASYDSETGQGAIFIVNRSQTDPVTADLIWQDGKSVQFDKAWQIAGTDPKQVNTWESPDQLVAQPLTAPSVDANRAAVTLLPLSFTVFTTRTA
jgi:alpha-N-arabinofuranosidase